MRLTRDGRFHTSCENASAAWRLSGATAYVTFIDTDTGEPAQRYPSGEPIKGFRLGHIAFDGEPPLSELMTALPQYDALWAAVSVELRQALVGGQGTRLHHCTEPLTANELAAIARAQRRQQ